jgi:hypothetical protein
MAVILSAAKDLWLTYGTHQSEERRPLKKNTDCGERDNM